MGSKALPWRGSVNLNMWLFIVAMCVMLIARDASVVWSGYGSALDRVRIETANLARSLAEQANDALHLADAVVLNLRDDLESFGTEEGQLVKLHNVMAARIGDVPGLRALYLCDADGICRISSEQLPSGGIDVRDRAHFIQHRQALSRDLLVGSAIRYRIDNSWVITLSRRINRPDGQFAGIVTAIIDSRYFADYFSQFEPTPGGSISLVSTDGILIARNPVVASYLGANFGRHPLFAEMLPRAPNGYLEYRADVDQVTRLSAYNRLKDYPLVVVVARAKDDVLASWRAAIWTHLAGVGVIVALVVLFGWNLSRQVLERARVEDQLKAAVLQNAESLRRLSQSEALFRRLYERTPVMMHSFDEGGQLVSVSDAWVKRLGYTRDEVIGQDATAFFTPASQAYATSVVRTRCQREGLLEDVNLQFIAKDGSVIDIELSAIREDGALGGHAHTLAVSKDVTVQKALHATLLAERERMAVTLHSIGDGVIATDEKGKITYLNPVAESLVGWLCEEAIGRDFVDVVQLQDADAAGAPLDPVSVTLSTRRISGLPKSAVLRNRNGTEYGVQDTVAPIVTGDGTLLGTVMVVQDVTDARLVSQQMSYLAHYDAMTGLPNRVLLQDRVNQACRGSLRHKRQFALIFMDLDRFKHVNDSLGHAAGDELLRVVARRLVATVRASDTVCRMGGDEFVMLLSDIRHSSDVQDIADKVLRAVAEPIMLKDTEVCIGISLGIAVYPDDGDDHDTLMRHADGAMYRSKFDGRNRSTFFSPELDQAPVARLQLEADVRRGLANGEFIAHYQPMIDAATRRVIAVEALARWARPGLGIESPSTFIPVAEECGLIVSMGAAMLQQVCVMLRGWSDTPLGDVVAAVNISPLQFADRDFSETVAHMMRSNGIAGSRLEFEITETTLMRDPDAALKVLAQIKALGIRVALDDFGTGYSSLSYLKRFPVDTVKIDRSFISDLETDTNDQALVRAIIAMCKSLNLHIIAEGVETEAQADILSGMGCPAFQGYLFAKPASAADTEAWLMDRIALPARVPALVV